MRECTLIIDQISWISAKILNTQTYVNVSFVMTDSLERVAEKVRAKVNARKQASRRLCFQLAVGKFVLSSICYLGIVQC